MAKKRQRPSEGPSLFDAASREPNAEGAAPLAERVRPAHLDDIAGALGRICRYNGNVSRFYSVAEHCCRVSDHLERTHGPIMGLAGLLHDAHEALLGDIPFPLQVALFHDNAAGAQRLREIQWATDQAIARSLAPFVLPDPLVALMRDPAVKEADKRILLDERADLLTLADRPWGGIEGLEPLGVDVESTRSLLLLRTFRLARLLRVVRWMPAFREISLSAVLSSGTARSSSISRSEPP